MLLFGVVLERQEINLPSPCRRVWPVLRRRVWPVLRVQMNDCLRADLKQFCDRLQVCQRCRRHPAADQRIRSDSRLGAALDLRVSPAGQCSHRADRACGSFHSSAAGKSQSRVNFPVGHSQQKPGPIMINKT